MMFAKHSLFLFILLLAFSPEQVVSQDIAWTYQSEIDSEGEKVQHAIYSPYRQWIAISYKEKVVLMDELGNKLFTTERSTPYGSICFSPDEKYLLIRNWRASGDIAFLDLNSFVVKKGIHKAGFKDAYTMKYVGDVHHILFMDDKALTLFEVNDQLEMELLQTFHNESEHSINGISVSDNGEWLAVSEAGTIMTSTNDYKGFDITLYHRKGSKFVKSDLHSSSTSKHFVKFIPGTNKLICSIEREYGKNKEKALLMFDCSKGKFNQISRLELEHEAEYAGISHDGNWMAVAPRGIRFFYIGNNKFEEHNETMWYHWYPHLMEFSPDGKHLLTFEKDKPLVQWNIDGLEGDIRSKLYNALSIDFPPAFKDVLSACSNCFDKIDKDLFLPKGEFETTEQFEKRRELAKSKVLKVLQVKLEEDHKVTNGKYTGIEAGHLLGYNADNQIFKANILGEDVAVKVPLSEAPTFKRNYSNAVLNYEKIHSDNTTKYYGFKVTDTKTGKSYPVEFKNNPFSFQKKSRRDSENGVGVIELSPNIPLKNLEQQKDTGAHTYALVVATNEYKEFGNLTNPVLDGETIAKELKERYNANTEVLIDPSLIQLKLKLREYAGYAYNKNDQLLIFIAGHGHFDNIYKEGYIVTSDSRLNDDAQISFLSHSSLRTIVKNIPCEHILLVMDVCFGGTFDQAVATGARGKDLYDEVDVSKYIDRKLQYKTRLVITSGGKRYVPDGRPGQHSPFARNVLAALRSGGGKDGILTVGELKQYVDKTEIQPYFGEFDGNEPGSDFLLITKPK